jgi:hypothetical protein
MYQFLFYELGSLIFLWSTMLSTALVSVYFFFKVALKLWYSPLTIKLQ